MSIFGARYKMASIEDFGAAFVAQSGAPKATFSRPET